MKVLVERYGDDAFGALASEVASVQGADPLARVTVVVGRGQVGLATRRRLAARPPGILNVRFLTFSKLAAELAPDWPAVTGRRPATPAVVAGAVRAALAGPEAGPLAPVADQPATARALARTYRDLRWAPPEAVAALVAGGGRAGAAARAVADVGRRLAGFYDDVDLVAAAAVATGGDCETGPVVVYLPARLRPVDHDLLAALEAAVAVTVVVGATGDVEADGPARDLVTLLGGRPEDHPAFTGGVERGDEVLSAPTADAEVLLAVRHLMARNADGVPLERMALAHNGTAPYPRLVRDLLARAGIPFNGAGIRPLAATVAGRTLLGALELADSGWRRDVVAGWITSAPLRHDGRLVPGFDWDTLSCEAGVVSGLDEWRERLAAHAAVLRARAEGEEENGAWCLREAGRCDGLVGFVAEVARRLDEAGGTWAQWSEWAGRFLRELLGEGAALEGWTAEELAALDAVHEAVQGLSALPEGRPSTGAFRAALAAELEAPAPQTSRFGHGILVGEVAEMVGLDLDVLWVLGMVDGAFPGRAADDVLVPDAVRRDHGLPLRGARAAEGRRDYLGALAAAGRRHLSFARGDQRQGGRLRPARLLLDTLGGLADRRLYARDLDTLGTVEGYASVASFPAAVAAGPGDPVSLDDWDLRSLLRWRADGRGLSSHFAVDGVLSAGWELQRARRSDRFTRFDGRIDGEALPSPADPGGAVQSPTGLESYAACPRRYLFAKVLRAEVREQPEEVLELGAKERGTLFHRVLERFVAEELARPEAERVGPGTPWGAEGQARLSRIAAEVFADFEQRGLTGREALWRTQRRVLMGELRHFLAEDDRYRAERGAAPLAVEEAFGSDGADPLEVALVDGRRVRFRGSVDRVDATADGGLSVLDYKTGRFVKEEGDPFLRGTRLQLPLYGLVARRAHRPSGPVGVRYWFVGDRAAQRGRYLQEGFTLDPGIEDRLGEVVGTLVGAIEGGRFPGNPGGCAFCDFNGVCPPDRQRSWERKRDDPWIADYRALAEPT
jgi:RecB family exonuclease